MSQAELEEMLGIQRLGPPTEEPEPVTLMPLLTPLPASPTVEVAEQFTQEPITLEPEAPTPPEPVDVPDGHKVCRLCDTPKPLDEFYRDERRKDGHHIYCKKCFNDKQKRARRRRNAQKKWDKDILKVYQMAADAGMSPQRVVEMVESLRPDELK